VLHILRDRRDESLTLFLPSEAPMNVYPLPEVGSRWRHFQGGTYEIVCLAVDERSLQKGVVYRELTSPFRAWFRPLYDFFSKVTWRGKETLRFLPEDPLE
jgi:hypothetical protein